MAAIVRRESTMMEQPGAVVDVCQQLIEDIPGARMTRSPRALASFPNGSKISFFGLKNEDDTKNIQGAQINYIGVDEATQMTKKQIMFLLSRNRGYNGAPCMVRLTCNPDPESFLREWVDWYLDTEGFPIKEKSGLLRYFTHYQGQTVWGNSRDEAARRGHTDKNNVTSFSFIPAKIDDNKDLLKNNNEYRQSLESQSEVERMRFLHGNWNIRNNSGNFFKPSYFDIVDLKEVPELVATARGWDLASTEGSGDHTASILMGRDDNNNFYIMDMDFVQYSPAKVQDLMLQRARQDGPNCIIRCPQDPGQAGKSQMAHLRRVMAGYTIRSRVMNRNKEIRASALSSAAENRMIKIVRGSWNETFLAHAEAFPPTFNSPDIIDATVEAFEELTANFENHKSMVATSPIKLGGQMGFSNGGKFRFGGIS